MKNPSFICRAVIGAAGGLIILGGASAAVAAEVDGSNVDVSVDIAPAASTGALTLSVENTQTSLTEVASDSPDVREFSGTLPTVTVTDDRSEVPVGVAWYVTGQSSDLAAEGGATISAGNLGWMPQLLSSSGDGQVAEGPQVDTVLDPGPNNVGLQGDEFLALALDSGEAATVGQWQANAGLVLKTPADVTPGAYSGTITLTLWEDAY